MTTTRVQTIHSAIAGARPAGRAPGELYTNWADNQLGVVNAAAAPVDLLAVRVFSTAAVYGVGDYVTFGGQLYQARNASGPGAFVPASWAAVTASVQSLNWFDTRALAVAATIPASVATLMTGGYATAGDGGGELYYRVGGSTVGGFQSADGAWWALEGASRTRFWSDVDNGQAIATPRVMVHRERIFVGAAADYSQPLAQAGHPTFGWLTEAVGANWIPRDSSLSAVSEIGATAISAVSRTSDKASMAAKPSTIAFCGYVVNDSPAPAFGRVAYFETQRESGAGGTPIMELVSKNKGNSITTTPYSAAAVGSDGIWISAGGDPGYGGAAANPSDSAIKIAGNDVLVDNVNGKWNKGIVFGRYGLTGTDGVTGVGTAIEMAKGHQIVWQSAAGTGAVIRSDVNTAGQNVSILFSNNAISLYGTSGVGIAAFQHVANGVNSLQITNREAGAGPGILATGADTDIDIRIQPKGAGAVRLVSNSGGGLSQVGTARSRFWSDVNNGAAITTPRILLQRERLFVGAAVDYSNVARSGNPTFGWLTSTTGPNWAARDGSLVAVAEDGNVAVYGASRASDGPSGSGAIGVTGYSISDAASPSAGWAGYFECERLDPSNGGTGIEIDVKNCGATPGGINPYQSIRGPHALWLACGPGSGAGGYGHTPTANSASAITVVCNTSGGNTYRFTSGINFFSTALAGVDGTDGEVTGGVGALEMARGHAIKWYASSGTPTAKLSIYSLFNSTDANWNIYGLGTGLIFSRNNNTENMLQMLGTAGASNSFFMQNNVAGAPPVLASTGSDTDVDIAFTPKGAGSIRTTSAAFKAMLGLAIPAGGTAGKGYMLSSTANFGVFFGSGLPTLVAAKGSLYLRSDGTSNVTRMYVATDSAGTWTACNTVA